MLTPWSAYRTQEPQIFKFWSEGRDLVVATMGNSPEQAVGCRLNRPANPIVLTLDIVTATGEVIHIPPYRLPIEESRRGPGAPELYVHPFAILHMIATPWPLLTNEFMGKLLTADEMMMASGIVDTPCRLLERLGSEQAIVHISTIFDFEVI